MATSPTLIDTINTILGGIGEHGLTVGEVVALNSIDFNKIENIIHFILQGRILTENSFLKYKNFLISNNYDIIKYTKNIRIRCLPLPIATGITIN